MADQVPFQIGIVDEVSALQYWADYMKQAQLAQADDFITRAKDLAQRLGNEIPILEGPILQLRAVNLSKDMEPLLGFNPLLVVHPNGGGAVGTEDQNAELGADPLASAAVLAADVGKQTAIVGGDVKGALGKALMFAQSTAGAITTAIVVVVVVIGVVALVRAFRGSGA